MHSAADPQLLLHKLRVLARRAFGCLPELSAGHKALTVLEHGIAQYISTVCQGVWLAAAERVFLGQHPATSRTSANATPSLFPRLMKPPQKQIHGAMQKEKIEVLPGLEPGLPESESGVITATL